MEGKPIIEGLSVKRSHCPRCDEPIYWYRLIPLFSWIVSKARCTSCGNKIHWRYPIIEMLSGAVCGASFWYFGFSVEAFLASILLLWLIAIAVIDFEQKLILDVLSLPLLWFGLLVNTQGYFTSLESGVYGAVAGYLLLWLIFHGFKIATGKDGLGYGDFKLLAAMGAWFGIQSLPTIIIIASITSLLFIMAYRFMKKNDNELQFPFGPFIALPAVLLLFFSDLIPSAKVIFF